MKKEIFEALGLNYSEELAENAFRRIVEELPELYNENEETCLERIKDIIQHGWLTVHEEKRPLSYTCPRKILWYLDDEEKEWAFYLDADTFESLDAEAREIQLHD